MTPAWTSSTVWLTGASSGIGEALVDVLVARGARVAITARSADRLDAIAARHPEGRVLAVPADVTDQDAVLTAARAIAGAFGRIDLAIMNAGGSRGRLGLPFDAQGFVDTHALNFLSVVYGVEAVLPGMVERGAGRIAIVASLSGYRGIPGAPHYSSSKAAAIHFAESMRFELAPRGIDVVVINPGFVRTPLTSRNRFHMPFLLEAPDAAERIVRGLERGRQEVHFPIGLSWPLKLMRVMPFWLYEAVMRRVSREAVDAKREAR